MNILATAPSPPVAPVGPPRDTGAPPLPNPDKRIGGGARSLRELLADPELAKPPAWDLRPYTMAGRLTLLVSPPKLGKTTFAAHYAAAKTAGKPFLDQQLDPA